jgi:hypothetical protein
VYAADIITLRPVRCMSVVIIYARACSPAAL